MHSPYFNHNSKKVKKKERHKFEILIFNNIKNLPVFKCDDGIIGNFFNIFQLLDTSNLNISFKIKQEREAKGRER